MWKLFHVVTARSASLRFAELFGRAVDRLGDPRPPMRIGALRTLELLADDHPTHRQAIVDVICGYLRMPALDDGPTRQIATGILAGHLRRDDNEPGRFWSGVSLDLTGATLVDLDLANCRIDGDLRLDHVIFLGAAKLRGITVGGAVGLRGAAFHEHAWLERVPCAGRSGPTVPCSSPTPGLERPRS